jgi:hypothetical protein
MNNLYHKVAVASVGIALSFTLGTNKEAKAATFTLTAPRFVVEGYQYDPYNSVGERVLDSEDPSAEANSIQRSTSSTPERRAFYEFNIGNLSLAPNTIISRAFLKFQVRNIRPSYRYFFIDYMGYVGNGKPDLSDFEGGERLFFGGLPVNYSYDPTINFDVNVTQFVNQRVSNGDAFAGFGIRNSTLFADYFGGSVSLANSAELNIETVPEPTTIFGSAIFLGVGGWLKRKKSTPQNKAKSQA